MNNLNINANNGGQTLGHGFFNGFSTIQTQTGFRDTEIVNTRNILKNSWNGIYATGKYKGNGGQVYGRITTPFRAVNNCGDFLGRVNYVCGGSNQINLVRPEGSNKIGSIINNCDATGVPASTCNVKYVYDGSDYTRFKKEMAVNKLYNDLKDGGYQNSSYVNIMAVHRF